jgi:cytochrome c
LRVLLVTGVLAGVILAMAPATAPLHGAELAHSRGEDLFERRCARCHGLGGDGDGGLAPPLIGVVGRAVASRSDYVYSDALKAKGGIWSAGALDRYIADPQAFAPGADMDVNSPDPAEREAIIGYLGTLK